MIQIGLAGVLGTLLAVQFKYGKEEYGIYISIALGLLIIFNISSQLREIISVLAQVGDSAQIEGVKMGILLKMVGVTYVAEFSSALCKDAGYQAIAAQIEIYSKLAIFLLSAPIILRLIRTIGEFLYGIYVDLCIFAELLSGDGRLD